MFLSVDDAGSLLYEGRLITDDALVRTLRKQRVRSGARGVVLPEDLPIELLLRVGGLINEAGMKMFYIDAQGERKEIRWAVLVLFQLDNYGSGELSSFRARRGSHGKGLCPFQEPQRSHGR